MTIESEPVALARTLLVAVAELHSRGYHGLRIHPGMNASGTAWRCKLDILSNTLLRYSSSTMERLTNAVTIGSDPRQLATDLERTYAEALAQARIEDAPYVAWFVAMLDATAPSSVPIAYADYGDYSAHWGTSPEGGTLSLPPP